MLTVYRRSPMPSKNLKPMTLLLFTYFPGKEVRDQCRDWNSCMQASQSCRVKATTFFSGSYPTFPPLAVHGDKSWTTRIKFYFSTPKANIDRKQFRTSFLRAKTLQHFGCGLGDGLYKDPEHAHVLACTHFPSISNVVWVSICNKYPGALARDTLQIC